MSARRIGNGTPYAAALICTRRAVSDEWVGHIEFDDITYQFHRASIGMLGETVVTFDSWIFPYDDSDPDELMKWLAEWHAEIVALFERVKATS